MKYILILFSLLTLNSCYFGSLYGYIDIIPSIIRDIRFTKENTLKTLDINIHEEIIYKNQFGEKLVFEVIQVTDNYDTEYYHKNNDALHDSLKDTPLFIYDRQITKLTTNKGNIITYTFKRFPIDIEKAIDDLENVDLNFTGSVELWGDYFFIDYEKATISMTIGNNTYQNVFVVKNDAVKEIETIYYVNKTGIIGFDTSSGTEWRLSK